MAKTQPSNGGIVVHDATSGRFVTVHGVGALKGRLTIADGIDLTKPIAAQVLKRARKSDRALANGKH